MLDLREILAHAARARQSPTVLQYRARVAEEAQLQADLPTPGRCSSRQTELDARRRSREDQSVH